VKKKQDFHELEPKELAVKEREAREQLFRLRFQIQMGQTDGLKKYRVLKKDLARILTEKRAQEIGSKA
jgi:large subunit ribosomal protein L29